MEQGLWKQAVAGSSPCQGVTSKWTTCCVSMGVIGPSAFYSYRQPILCCLNLYNALFINCCNELLTQKSALPGFQDRVIGVITRLTHFNEKSSQFISLTLRMRGLCVLANIKLTIKALRCLRSLTFQFNCVKYWRSAIASNLLWILVSSGVL